MSSYSLTNFKLGGTVANVKCRTETAKKVNARRGHHIAYTTKAIQSQRTTSQLINTTKR